MHKLNISKLVKIKCNEFFKIIGFLKSKTPKTEIAYLARFDRKKLIETRYNNYKNFYEKNIDSKKFYVINNYGHLNHLKFLTKNSKHAILKRNNIWLLLPNKSEIMTEKDFVKCCDFNLENAYYLPTKIIVDNDSLGGQGIVPYLPLNEINKKGRR